MKAEQLRGAPRRADVVAAFDNQDDVETAVMQLRLAGFEDDRIGAFARSGECMMDMMDRHHGFTGAVIGSGVGIALGVVLAALLNRWSEAARDVSDMFGLSATLVTCGALFVGLIGWSIGLGVRRDGVECPALDSGSGAFTLAVASGTPDAHDRAQAVLRQYGGRERSVGTT